MSLEDASFSEKLNTAFRKWLIEQFAPEYLEMIAQPPRIVINGDGRQVNLVKGSVDVKWRPLPVPIYGEEVIARVSFDVFKNMLIGDAKNVAFKELGTKLSTYHFRKFLEVDKKVTQELAMNIIRNLGPQAKLITQRMVSEKKLAPYVDSRQLLQEVVNQALSSYKEEVIGYLEDSLVEEIENLWTGAFESVVEQIISISKQYSSVGTNTVLPKNVKLFFAKGSEAVVVVEEEPKVRSVLFHDSYLSISNRVRNNVTPMNLAFPYVVFVIKIVGGKTSEMSIAYNTKPLESKSDRLYRANLPNIWGAEKGYSICTKLPSSSNTDLYREINRAIAHFWQSSFNNDITTGVYWPGDIKLGDRKKNFLEWESRSSTDPLFVLENDVWEKGPTLEDLISFKGGTGSRGVADNFDIGSAIRDFGNKFRSGLGNKLARKLREDIGTTNKFGKSIEARLSANLDKHIKETWGKYAEEIHAALPDSLDPVLISRFVQSIESNLRQVVVDEFDTLAEQVPLRITAKPADLSQNIVRRQLR